MSSMNNSSSQSSVSATNRSPSEVSPDPGGVSHHSLNQNTIMPSVGAIPPGKSALSASLGHSLARAPAIPTVWPCVLPVVGSACTTIQNLPFQQQQHPHLTGSLPTSAFRAPPHHLNQHPTGSQQRPKLSGLFMEGLHEIQPCEEGPEDRRAHHAQTGGGRAAGGAGSSSRPMIIPHSHSQARTYRVAFQPSTSAPVHRAYLGNSAEAEVVLLVDSGDAPQAMRPQAAHSGSQGRTFLGSLFSKSRNHTPDNSVHGADLLPHHYRQSPGGGGDVLSPSSLEVGSILGRATGAFRRQPSMSRTLREPDPVPAAPKRTKSANLRGFMSVGNLYALAEGKQGPKEGSPSRDPSVRGGNVRGPARGGPDLPPVQRSGQDVAGLAYPHPFSLPRSSSVRALLQMEAGDPNMSAADIAVLSSSLPTSFGGLQGGMRRVDSLTSNCSLPSDSHAGFTPSVEAWIHHAHSQGGSLVGAHSLGMQASGNLATTATLPICLICLEMLTPQDFASGEAIQLQCLCKGDLAMRHRACAIEWSNVKGNLLCDICKHPISNLPEIDPAILAAREAARRRRQPGFAITDQPTTADYVFDGIRVAWVTVICCILFVDGMSVSNTFLIGATAGMIYCVLSFFLQWAFNRWRAARAAAALQRQQASQPQRVDRPTPGSPAGLATTWESTHSGEDSLLEPLLITGGDSEQ